MNSQEMKDEAERCFPKGIQPSGKFEPSSVTN